MSATEHHHQTCQLKISGECWNPPPSSCMVYASTKPGLIARVVPGRASGRKDMLSYWSCRWLTMTTLSQLQINVKQWRHYSNFVQILSGFSFVASYAIIGTTPHNVRERHQQPADKDRLRERERERGVWLYTLYIHHTGYERAQSHSWQQPNTNIMAPINRMSSRTALCSAASAFNLEEKQ